MALTKSRPRFGRLAGIVFSALVLVLSAALLSRVVTQHQVRWRGVVLGRPPEVAHASIAPWGTTVALEQYDEAGLAAALDELEGLGMVWLRQRLPWSEIEPAPRRFEWERWDRAIAAATERGFQLILVLDTSPAWARSPEDAAQPLAPPADPADFARFAAAVAERYGREVDFYQLWDEPNIRPHWGAERHIAPAGYALLLRRGAVQIRAADPSATILTAALAPNGEAGGYNMSEVRFLAGLYEAGAAADFDVVAVKGFGFWSGPDDRRAEEAVLNWSRLLLVRELMVMSGDGGRAIWLTEGGWASLPPGWQGGAPPWGSDDPRVQGNRLAAAIERAQIEWPWLGAMVLMEFQPAVPRDDPRWGLALRGADERPTPLGRRVGELARGWVPGPGHWPAGGPGSAREGDWLHFRFLGSETVVELRSSEVPALRLNGTEVGGSLRSGADGWELRLSPGALRQHELSLRPQAAARGFVVSRNVSFALFYTLAAVLATVGLAAGLRLGWLVWTLPWGRVAEYWRSRSETTQIAVVAALVAAFYLVPDFWLSLVLAGALWLLFVARLDLGLAATVLAVPFFLLPKPFFALRFSLVELLTLLCLAAWGWRVLWQVAAAIRARRLDRVHAILVGALVPRDALDWGMLVFLVAGAVSPLWSHVYGVAAREFRVVVLEPMLFYWLVRRAELGPREQLRLVDTLVLSAVALSIHGLYQWFFTVDIIRAEGVHRARAVYGSPNNLALFLDRVVPLVIAFLPPVADRWNRRARLYAFALAVMGPALFLTFTRGAWLLAIPASLFFIAWRRPGLPRRAIVAATLVAVLALIPFAGTERLRNLANFQGGTGVVRVYLWRSTLAMLRDDFGWLKGIGLDNFLYLYPRYILPEAWREPNLSHPHNILLHYWVALGLLGVVVLIWQQAAFWRAAIRAWRTRTPPAAPLVLGLSASMVAFLAHGLIDNSYFLVDLAFVYALTAALIAQIAERDT